MSYTAFHGMDGWYVQREGDNGQTQVVAEELSKEGALAMVSLGKSATRNWPQCEAERKRGGKCTRPAKWSQWVFSFQGSPKESSPFWVDVCGHHVFVTAVGATVTVTERD